MKMTKIGEKDLLSRLQPGEVLIPPLVVRQVAVQEAGDRADARAELGLADGSAVWRFVIEVKAHSTPQAVQSAVAQARSLVRGDEQPLVLVPYLSPERLADLEREGASGVDLCGNGTVTVPGRFYLFRSGQPNLYPESRPLNNPYAGRSALVARVLFVRPRWSTLTELADAIRQSGCGLSLSQVSKAVQALSEDLIVSKRGGEIALLEPVRLLDRLGAAWRGTRVSASRLLRLKPGTDWNQALATAAGLRWSVTGACSVRRYAALGESGPWRVAVDDLARAVESLGGETETVQAFADIELVETEEPGAFFQSETDASGMRWASPIQCWLELQAGDARQRQAAEEIRVRILKGVGV